jgi:hypothetical protein
MNTAIPLTPVLEPGTLYLGDGGRCFCGEHAGASAKYSGRDLSGGPVTALDRATCIALGEDADLLRCERPGCGRRAEGGDA